jgi:hypothetical protein
MTGVATGTSAIAVASGDDVCRTCCDRTGTSCIVAGEVGVQHTTKVLWYRKLTVGDAKESDMMTIKVNNDVVFKKACLCLLSSNHEYDIEYAVINQVTYLKTWEKYQSWEFEQIFGFGHDCHDFVKGKIVVVRPSSF